MKSKYFLTLFLIGVFPALLLTGVYFYMIFTQAPPVPKVAPQTAAGQQTVIQSLQTQVQTMASSMYDAIRKTHEDTANLFAHNTEKDITTFLQMHQGTAIGIFSMKGKFIQAYPNTVSFDQPNYAGSEEFGSITKRFADQGGATYQFYTQRLGFPAFINAIPLSGADSFAEVALNLASFFPPADAKSGEYFLLDAASGRYLYHSNPTQLALPFNNPPQPWLTKVATDLNNKQSGPSLNGNVEVAAYSYLGFGAFGVVHTYPLSAAQASSPVAAPKAPSLDDLPELLKTPMGMTSIIALFACMAWVFIVGSICYGMILAPLRRASGAVLNASQGKGTLTPESAKAFGGDEVGQMVQAVSLLMQKLEQEKEAANQEKEEALRRGRTEVDAQGREAANKVSVAQQQAQAARAEANEKNQTLNDKLKELDALKGMSEGLRNQNEQAKAENAKLRGQINEIGESQADFQKQIASTQNDLKEMESKMLKAVAASSAIHVSQVRAAAIRTMAEELKTTLGIIKGYVSSTLGSTSGGISEKQQEFLGMVINRSARLEKFINDLLDIYQVEIEQQDSKTEEVNLASEIEGLAFNFQAQADVKTIKIKVEAKPDIPKVPIVRRRFNQLWNILYLQIIKDAPRGSSITIGVEPIGDNVKVTVQDPGLVVVPDSLPKLFDEFYDPKHPASPQLAGTGLKFALVKTILAAHGGGAVAEKADPGTRLTLTFPTKVKKPGAAPPAPMVAPSPSVSAPAAPKTGPLTPPPLRPTPGVAAPGAGIGVPKPPAPGATPGIGLSKPPMSPSLGVPGAPAGAPGLGVPKPAAPAAGLPPLGTPKLATPAPAVGGAGVLDALISGGNIPSVTSPGLPKPPAPAVPGAASPLGAPPATPGLPKPPMPGALGAIPPSPAATAPPAMPKPPMPSPGALDALLDKKPAAPATGIPATPKPPVPGVPPMPGAAAPAAPRPAVPGAPPVPGAEPVIPKAPLPVPPGIPGTGPMAPRPPLTGAPPVPGAAAPGVPSAAPKVVPTNLKPTTPPPGILDLDNMDGMKLDAGAPKPAAPAMPGLPKPPIPGAPPMPGGAPRPGMPPPGMPPMGGPKSPSVPPGGLQATPPPKTDDGELIE